MFALAEFDEGIRFRLRGGDRNAGLEAADDGDCVAPAADFVEGRGQEDVELNAGREDGTEVECGRQDADDGNATAVHRELLAEDVGIGGVTALPEGVT